MHSNSGYTGTETSPYQDQYNADQQEQWKIAALPQNRYNLSKAQQEHLAEIKGTFQDTGALHSITYNLKRA